mgnify:CR=1 FL=1
METNLFLSTTPTKQGTINILYTLTYYSSINGYRLFICAILYNSTFKVHKNCKCQHKIATNVLQSHCMKGGYENTEINMG